MDYDGNRINTVQDEFDRLNQEIERLKADNARLRDALEFYAEPHTYHALTILAEEIHCGEFMQDIKPQNWDDFYGRSMPGAKAREVLETLEDKSDE